MTQETPRLKIPFIGSCLSYHNYSLTSIELIVNLTAIESLVQDLRIESRLARFVNMEPPKAAEM